jgi:hypothetical protein
MSVDFAWIFLPNSSAAGSISVASGANVLFSQISNQPTGSNLSLNPVTGVVSLNDSGGFYQISFGVQPANANAVSITFELRVNGAVQNRQVINFENSGGSTDEGGPTVTRGMYSLTTIVNLPANATINVVNTSAGAVVLNTTPIGIANGIAAYMTIVKLQ